MQLRHEAEIAAQTRRGDRPAGERASDLSDVLLGVAAVDAKRVQLQQFAAVVLVQTFRCVRTLLRHRLRHARHRLERSTAASPGRTVSANWTLTRDRMRSV